MGMSEGRSADEEISAEHFQNAPVTFLLHLTQLPYRFSATDSWFVCIWNGFRGREKKLHTVFSAKDDRVIRKIMFRLGDQNSALGLISNYSDHGRESRDDSRKFYAVEAGSSDEKRRKSWTLKNLAFENWVTKKSR